MKTSHKPIPPSSVLPACLLWVLLLAPAGRANTFPDDVWKDAGNELQKHAASETWTRPSAFRAVYLQHALLRPLLARAPRESRHRLPGSDVILSLPMPDGSAARFAIAEAPIMEPELAARFPEIKTYIGRGLDDPAATARFDLTPAGFHAQVLSPGGAVYIEPYLRGNASLHAAYYRKDYHPAGRDFECLAADGDLVPKVSGAVAKVVLPTDTLRTYRLACAATAEYTQYFGGTVPEALAAIVTAINRVTGIYETELGIRLMLVAQNDQIIYTNAAADPYSNGNASALLSQNQATLDAIIGTGNYDIGHVFSTAGGGLALVGVAGVTGLKAQGQTGTHAPVGDAFYIDYVAHEMGHQFGATHTFNSSANACGFGNRCAATAYEPGSGSTIMSYAGICSTDNLERHSAPYFHSASLEQILTYTTVGPGSLAVSPKATGNSPPTVDAGPGFIIPMGTPFTLTATGSDPDGNALTYCWEEQDLGPSVTLQTPDNGSSPLFRSFGPTSAPERTFPQWSDILNHTTTPGEMLPSTNRTLNFRVTARDNHSGAGATATAAMQVTVATNAGPFVVTAPAAAAMWSGMQTITWDVAGTANGPVNAGTVTILLSTNGGYDFPIVLARNVPNTGASEVLLPAIDSAAGRVKVEADGNIFFAVSPGNFTLEPPLTPVLQPLAWSNGIARLVWTARPGRAYRVQYKSDLNTDTWTDLLPDVTAAETTASLSDIPNASGQRYYRVVLLP